MPLGGDKPGPASCSPLGSEAALRLLLRLDLGCQKAIADLHRAAEDRGLRGQGKGVDAVDGHGIGLAEDLPHPNLGHQSSDGELGLDRHQRKHHLRLLKPTQKPELSPFLEPPGLFGEIDLFFCSCFPFLLFRKA